MRRRAAEVPASSIAARLSAAAALARIALSLRDVREAEAFCAKLYRGAERGIGPGTRGERWG